MIKNVFSKVAPLAVAVAFACGTAVYAGDGACGTGSKVTSNEALTGPTIKLAVTGMNCESCEGSIQTALKSVEGVTGSKVMVKEGVALVSYNADKAVSNDALIAAVKKAGYEATVAAN